MNMQKIDSLDVKGKRVLVRVDFNVPLAEGTVTDDTRIRAALPTIEYLIDNGARVICMSHLGRPKGEGFEEQYSLAPVARVLSRILGQNVVLAPGCSGPEVEALADDLNDGEVLLLENLRFDPREKKNDPAFAAELAKLADLYVNDAFGAAHRAHASVEAITHHLPSCAGFLLNLELDTLGALLEDPRRPFVAILGGSKVSDKIKIIDALLDTVDTLLIGGGMCFTFLKAQGYEIGKSLCEDEWQEKALQMLEKAKLQGVKLLLPIDIVAAPFFGEDAPTKVCAIDEMEESLMGLDIGPASAELFARAINEAKTVFWNGPMGVFELKPFEAGTKTVAKAVAGLTEASTVVGGGDSVAALKGYGLEDRIGFVSTGGGASMQLLEGTPLPGVEALNKQ